MRLNIHSYRFRIVFTVIMLLVAVNTVTMLIFSNSIKNTANEILAKQSAIVVTQAIKYIDVAKHNRLAETNDQSDDYYIETCNVFNKLKQSYSAKYLYTMKYVSGKNFKYIIDGSDFDDEENFSPLGTEEDLTSYGVWPFRCIKEKKTMISGITKQDGWGWTASVYMPIIDENNNCDSFIGCDYDVDDVIATLQNHIYKFGCLLLFFVLSSIIIIFVVIKTLFTKIELVRRSMLEIANGSGDLTVHIEADKDTEVDDLARACNKVMEYLHSIVKKIKESMTKLSASNKELSIKNIQMVDYIDKILAADNLIGEKARNQKELTDETMHSVKSMMESVRILTDDVSHQVAAISQSSSAIEEITANINSIDLRVSTIGDEYKNIVNETVTEQNKQHKITEQIMQMVEEAKNLYQANNMIDEIAQRTNLLAMNAAIEASHAGKFGEGFSVVAAEIRRLSETSTVQTKSITSIVQEIEKSIYTMKDVSAESVESFGKLGSAIKKMEAMLDEIRNGMHEQAIGAKNILDGFTTLQSSTQSIQKTSDNMLRECNNVNSQMNAVTRHSQDVLKNADNAIGTLDGVKDFANSVTGLGNNNAALSDEVQNMLSKYKV